MAPYSFQSIFRRQDPQYHDQDHDRQYPKRANYLPQSKPYSKPGRPSALYSSLPYYFVHAASLAGYMCIIYLHNPFWILAFIALGLPLLDHYFQDWRNPTSEQYKELEDSVWFQIPLYIQTVIDTVFFFKIIHMLTTEQFPLIFCAGSIAFTGVIGGYNFIVAHEIFHKHHTATRVYGTLIMLKNLYMHFFIEHNYGHHKKVATPEDPATSRYGETVYHFLPRVIIGSYISAWNIEKRRLTKVLGYSTHWVVQNRMIWFTLSYFLFPTFIFGWLGLKGLMIYLMVVALSIGTLETVNYIEHYGLMRKELAPGEYEKVNVTHSWNAPHRFTNYLVFKLQRHSDHHENAYKPYHLLASNDESPMLPYGYTWCLLMSFFPRRWFHVMDRSLLAHKEKRILTLEEVRLNRKNSVQMSVILLIQSVILLVWNNHAFKNWTTTA